MGGRTVEEQQPLAGLDIDVSGLVDADCACRSPPHGGPRGTEAGGGRPRPQIWCKTPVHWCGAERSVVVVVRAADG